MTGGMPAPGGAYACPMIAATPDRFLERMLAIDPAYGSQQHQQTFLRMLAERQRLQPCATDHEHANACYSQATLAESQRAVSPLTQHALPLPVYAAPHNDQEIGAVALW